MVNLSKRSYQKELLDGNDIPFDDIRQNMKELNMINSWLGGHAITIAGIRKIIENAKNIGICEIGCGGGDNLAAIQKWCKRKNINAKFFGIDIKPACIAFAQQQYPHLNVTWITSDYQKTDFGNEKPDIIFSSLFCHHFAENELIDMLQWMSNNCKKGFFINDLERNYIAYYAIKILTKLFSSSYLVKNDAPLSVARGFTKREWQVILQKAKLSNFLINWKWAFRHLIVYQHEQP